MRALPAWFVVAALFAFATPASAIVTQPDGTVIPQRSDLQDLFTSRADPVSAIDDAAIVPETFHPGCTLTFTVVSRGNATFQDVFGWYNATGSAPAASDLHVLIPCSAAPGTVATLDLAHEPDYRGGEIGFFLRTPEQSGACANNDCCASLSHPGYTYYSERRFNPDNTGSATSFIHLLVYNSRSVTRAFYFAWEDLYGGGDNQFTDFVAQVGNIVCSGGGGSCDTGMPGICAQGTQQCRAGALQCLGVNAPGTEQCNGLDDDCNGTVDDGTGLCGSNQVCDRGACVDRCVEGSCFAGFACSQQGTCVEEACATVTCPSGQRCIAGACVAPCDGVTCPTGLACRAGRCVDPCAGVTCESEQVCSLGVCQPRCECGGCGAGLSCANDGRCVDSACVGMNCSSGTVCAGGACVDPCTDAVCPRGQVCREGACVDAPAMPDVVDVDATADVSMPGGDDPAIDASTDVRAMDTSAGDGSFGNPHPGCSCRVPATRGPRTRASALALGVIIALALRSRRRRR